MSAGGDVESLRAERDLLRAELARVRASSQRQLDQMNDENKALRVRVRSLERLTWAMEDSDASGDEDAVPGTGRASGAAGAAMQLATSTLPLELSRPADASAFLPLRRVSDFRETHGGRNVTSVALCDGIPGAVFTGAVDKRLEVRGGNGAPRSSPHATCGASPFGPARVAGNLLFEHALTAPVLAIDVRMAGPARCATAAAPPPRPASLGCPAPAYWSPSAAWTAPRACCC